MSCFGVILVGYNCQEYFDECLAPWLEARRTGVGGHQIKICAVNCPFTSFPLEDEDGTRAKFTELLENNEIDFLVKTDNQVDETFARGKALEWCVANGCDFTWMCDLDEFYKLIDIERIINFVEKQKFVASFKIPLKNYIFNGDEYLEEPFTPFRIHRLKYQSYVANSFWDDNNIQYKGTITRDFKFDINFPYTVIPSSLVWIRHQTWMNNERSKSKVFYQKARNWNCSYQWNEIENKLEFNPAIPKPKVIKE